MTLWLVVVVVSESKCSILKVNLVLASNQYKQIHWIYDLGVKG